MKIVRAYPPNYAELKAIFPISGRAVFFAWGDVLYDPTGDGPSMAILAHERVHGRRQLARGAEA